MHPQNDLCSLLSLFYSLSSIFKYQCPSLRNDIKSASRQVLWVSFESTLSLNEVMTKAPLVLLVNPWITDFAAYDLWARPLGLLLLASLLREGGCGVAYLDCLDRCDDLTNSHADVLPGKRRRFGVGKYPRMPLAKPSAYAELPRKYYRHGIHPQSLVGKLKSMPKPDLIWVTSMMTYWYPGVQQTIGALREVFADTPVWLGGVYARLCPQHARETSGAHEVVTLALADLPDKLEAATRFRVKNRPCWRSLAHAPAPALDLQPNLDYAVLMASVGCPFNCPYCASRTLAAGWERFGAEQIYHHIRKWHIDFGVRDFAFYDDALLIDADASLKPALRKICEEGWNIRFHTPNALHVRALTPGWCQLLFQSGFTTIRLGLETADAVRQAEWGGKVNTPMFLTALENLVRAGFQESQIGVYLLCGLPEQSPEEVREAIDLVRAVGAQPYLSEYSPVPGSQMWSTAVALSRYPIAAEPLYHNNTFFACRRPEFGYEDLLGLKAYCTEVRRSHPQASD